MHPGVVVGAGQPYDRASIQLATRRNNYIPNEQRQELNPARVRASIELWQQHHPYAALRSTTAIYNCMGMVFAARRTWVDPEYMGQILHEDDYYPIRGGKDEAKEGDDDVPELLGEPAEFWTDRRSI